MTKICPNFTTLLVLPLNRAHSDACVSYIVDDALDYLCLHQLVFVLYYFVVFLLFRTLIVRPSNYWMIRVPLELYSSRGDWSYVRDVKSGKVRAICGATYMLTQDEELWAKELLPGREELCIGWAKDLLADISDHCECLTVAEPILCGNILMLASYCGVNWQAYANHVYFYLMHIMFYVLCVNISSTTISLLC